MAASDTLFLINILITVLFITILLSTTPVSSRDLPQVTNSETNSGSTTPTTLVIPATLPAKRLSFSNVNGNDIGDCWTAVGRMKSCSDEIIDLLQNGTADIDVPCCSAIVVVALECLTPVFNIIWYGYTSEDMDFLVDFCQNGSADASSLRLPTLELQE